MSQRGNVIEGKKRLTTGDRNFLEFWMYDIDEMSWIRADYNKLEL